MKGKLFIYPHDDVKLPGEYHFSHNLLVKLHDDLVWFLIDNKTQKKFDLKIDLTKSDGSFDTNLQGQELFNWLLKQGYQNETNHLISTHLVEAIISDICHFVYQALDSAKNIRMTVALSLLRKPFLENLLIIEQLLTEEMIFLKKYETEAINYDPAKISHKKKRDLINNSINQIRSSIFLDEETIHQLRWDKSNSLSIYANANLATHLVTTRNRSYKTDKQNLNFIFSGYDEWDSQLQYFYIYVPYLLYYTVEIIDQYLLDKKILTLKKFKERKFIRMLGQMMHFDQFNLKADKGRSILNRVFKGFKLKCQHCNRVNHIYKSDIFNLVHDDYIFCKYCLHELMWETDSSRKLINKTVK